MLTLSLLRHAKSNWDDTDLDDFERPLAKRGVAAAPEMGRAMRELKLKPDLVLCSTAVRTRATLALVLLELGPPVPEVEYDDRLYLATPAAMLARLRKVDDKIRHVMIVGHNPGTHALALELTGVAKREDMADLASKFPTAGFANITFEDDRWRDVKSGSGRLVVFLTPRKIG
jgi:phosphohistidine phosphatase